MNDVVERVAREVGGVQAVAQRLRDSQVPTGDDTTVEVSFDALMNALDVLADVAKAQASDAIFLHAAARYFERRPTGGEDMAHWANVYNAENCRRIAGWIERLGSAALADASPDIGKEG